jgi:hypothetical protein
MLICGDASGLASRAVLIEGFREVAEAVPAATKFLRLSCGSVRSDLSLSLPRKRAKKPCDVLLVLGDRCAILSSLVISEYELGVGLEGRPRRLVLEANAELRAEGWFERTPYEESSRLVVGRNWYWLMSARPSGALFSSLLPLCRWPVPGSLTCSL